MASQVETKRLNERVKRNIARFPENFCFQLTKDEYDRLRSQIATSSEEYGGRRYLPYVFTEQGIAMLSAVLNSETAINVSIKIMNVFVEMRRFMASNAMLFERISAVVLKQLEFQKRQKNNLMRSLSIFLTMLNLNNRFFMMVRYMMHLV